MFRLKEAKIDLRPPRAFGLMVLVACLVVSYACSAYALGTPAGTVIANTATVSYTMGSDPTSQTVTASNNFSVLEVIDLLVLWQDATSVNVASPQNNRALTFLLTNTGNGPEAFSLNALGNLAGDDFDPVVQSLWLETNGTPGLQMSGAPADTPAAATTPILPADDSLTIYLVSNIPSGYIDGNTGQAQLSAGAATSGASGVPAGTTLPGAGSGGVDAIVGISSGGSVAVGTYIVATASVNLVKTIQQISDPAGGSQPFPGAQVTYSLTVDVTGSGPVQGLVITDMIPTDMTYLPSSIVLDGTIQTDAADAPADNSDFNVTSANTVTVDLGNVVAPATHVIEFTTTIN